MKREIGEDSTVYTADSGEVAAMKRSQGLAKEIFLDGADRLLRGGRKFKFTNGAGGSELRQQFEDWAHGLNIPITS